MLFIPPPIFRRRRRFKPSGASAPAPVGPLTLVSAVYNSHSPRNVELVFDRAIDISALLKNQIAVFVGSAHTIYVGTGTPTLLDPVTLHVPLIVHTSATGSGVKLTAS